MQQAIISSGTGRWLSGLPGIRSDGRKQLVGEERGKGAAQGGGLAHQGRLLAALRRAQPLQDEVQRFLRCFLQHKQKYIKKYIINTIEQTGGSTQT